MGAIFPEIEKIQKKLKETNRIIEKTVELFYQENESKDFEAYNSECSNTFRNEFCYKLALLKFRNPSQKVNPKHRDRR